MGIDILQGLWLQTTAGEFRLRIRVVKAVLRGHDKHLPRAFPVPWHVTNTKQFKLPGGHKEIGETLQELEKVDIIKPTHTLPNSPVWPVKMQDDSCHMTMDYRELNKVVPLMACCHPLYCRPDGYPQS